jgi:hypothetical protein
MLLFKKNFFKYVLVLAAVLPILISSNYKALINNVNFQ